jgi:hypothetical protein
MSEEKVQFVPFNTINEFMLPEYRQHVISSSLSTMDQLSAERRSRLVGLIKKTVNIPGFRNSSLAPLPLKIKGCINSFERVPQFTAQVLMAWSELNADLRDQVYALLKARNWELLPADTDRTVLPGFLINWPEKETYEELNKEFVVANPDSKASEDDVRLMVVWLGTRLPYQMSEVEEEEK